MLNVKTEKKSFKKASLREYPRTWLIIQTRNSWNLTSGFNQEAQFPTKLIFEDEVIKISKFKKKLSKKKNYNERNEDQITSKKKMEDEL